MKCYFMIEFGLSVSMKERESMTEVAVFLSRNSPIGNSLRDLSERYDRLSDVWENCDRWDLMFEFLDDRILEFPTHRVEDPTFDRKSIPKS
jgi:hypothetical protein